VRDFLASPSIRTDIISRNAMFSRLKSLFTKQPPVEFRDAELGVLTLDSGVWIGTAWHDGRKLRFLVAGTDSAPDAGLLVRVRALLARFADTERKATEFLRSREPEVGKARLDFYSFDFLWEDKLEDFALEFLADGDDSRVWRVEFIAGQPSQTGFDD
jgi:hypothetical protein